MSNEEKGYGLIVSFPDQSASFVNGFEAGQVWSALESGAYDVSNGYQCHEENREVILRIARHFGYSVDFTTSGEGWLLAHFSRSQRPKLHSV